MKIYDSTGKNSVVYYPHNKLPFPIECGETTIEIQTLQLRFTDDVSSNLIRTSCHNLTMHRELFMIAFNNNFSDYNFLMLFNEVVFVGNDDQALLVANALGSEYSTDLWFDTEMGIMRTFVYKVN